MLRTFIALQAMVAFPVEQRREINMFVWLLALWR